MIASRAPDGQRLVARPVEIDEHPARDERRVECLRSVEALLLGDREEQLERPVQDRVIVRDGHRRRDPDPVVRAERGSLGPYPVVLDANVDPPFAVDRTGCSDRARRPCPGATGGRRSAPSSRPGDAGTRTTTFPSASARASSPRAAAQARTYSRAGPSCFEGREMRVSSKKRSQRSAGSSPASGSTFTAAA